MQKIKKEVPGKRKWNLENNTRGAETAAALLYANKVHIKAALEEEKLQWTDVKKLLGDDEIIRFDAIDRLENNNIA